MIVLCRTTTRCNYACGFCAYDRRLDIARDEVGGAEALRFGELLADWSRARAKPVSFSWLGGEPLLWRPIWQFSAMLVGQGLAISATTNGSTLHRPEARAGIVAHFAELTVSIDGPAPVHDQLRGRAGAWDKIRDGLGALAAERGSAPLKLRANIVLMCDTIAHFAELCMALAEWGVDEITFNQLGGLDRPAFFSAQRLRAEDVTALAMLVPALRHRLSVYDVTLYGDARYLDRLRASASGEALAVDDCRPGRHFLFVDEHGIVAPCSFSGAAYGVPLAALRTVADLDALPARFAAARAE